MNGTEGLYREFGEYMCRMLQSVQKSEDGLPVPSGSQVRNPLLSPLLVSAPAAAFLTDPYVVAGAVAAAVTTSDSMMMMITPYDSQLMDAWITRDSQTMPPKRSSRGDPPPQAVNGHRKSYRSGKVLKAAIRADFRERVRNASKIVLEDPMLLPLLGNVLSQIS
ncbi:hypothetical protein Tco_1029371 [Tanacetum coccineum]|uniref:Uncharacterized protein n=1 Tax=Tanacetum coccineum TaxID=301880 RepID=A0ABQ5G385_9ASTR